MRGDDGRLMDVRSRPKLRFVYGQISRRGAILIMEAEKKEQKGIKAEMSIFGLPNKRWASP